MFLLQRRQLRQRFAQPPGQLDQFAVLRRNRLLRGESGVRASPRLLRPLGQRRDVHRIVRRDPEQFRLREHLPRTGGGRFRLGKALFELRDLLVGPDGGAHFLQGREPLGMQRDFHQIPLLREPGLRSGHRGVRLRRQVERAA